MGYGSTQGFRDRSCCISPRTLAQSGPESVRVAIDAHIIDLLESIGLEVGLGVFECGCPHIAQLRASRSIPDIVIQLCRECPDL